ncbi:MAG: PAS domain S-box protein [Clostridium sp.]
MEQVFNSIDHYILVVGKSGKILFCNNALLCKLGYKYIELENTQLDNLLKLQKEEWSNILNKLEKKSEDEILIGLYSKNHEENYFIAKINLERWKDEEAFIITLKDQGSKMYKKEDLERLLDTIPYNVWMKNLEGEYIYTNKFHCELICKKKEEIIGCTDFDFWDLEESENFRYVDNAIILDGRPIMHEIETNVRGKGIWFATYKAPLFDTENKVEYVVGVSRDISFRKKMEAELSRSHNELNTLNNLVNVNFEDDESIVKNIQDDMLSKLCADGVGIWSYDDEKEELASKLQLGLGEKLSYKNSKLKVSKEGINKFLNDYSYEFVAPIEELKYLNVDLQELKNNDIKYVGSYKIVFNNKFIGIMNILYKEYTPSAMSNNDFIKTLCSQIATILVNSNLTKSIKRVLKKNAEIESELKLFLDAAVEIMAMLDEDGNFIRVNAGWTKNLGWSEAEILNMKWSDILLKEDVEPTIDFVKKLKEGDGVGRFTNRYIAKNGDIKWLEWSSRYIESKKVSVCTARDVTKQREIEEQRIQYEKDIEIEKVKNEFFANISHEFKTPLNIILATIQVINKNIDNKKILGLGGVDVRKYVTSIKQNSYRLLRLVNNLIDMSRIDTGFYQIHLENQNIVSVVEDITMSVAQYTESKGLELTFDTQVEEQIIACDSEKIERIMLNLLSNAIKFTSECGKIEVQLTIKGGNVIVSVKDSGEGIEKEKLDLIFNRFVQVDNYVNRGGEGSGIGLYLVKSLVEMHGGNIRVSSQLGVGTTFEFDLPITVLKTEDNGVQMKTIVSSKVEKRDIEFADISN